jgi:hypothetical protein
MPVTVLAGAVMLSTFFLMGMPGAALYALADLPFGARLPGFHGDHALPIAFFMNLLWPPVLPLAVAAVRHLLDCGVATRRPGSHRLAAVVVGLLLPAGWAVLLATALHALAAWQSISA